jgi:hypothetical protein
MFVQNGSEAVPFVVTKTSHSGGSSSPVVAWGRLVVQTWLPQPFQVQGEPLLPARWDEVEELLRSHCARLDGVFRQLA